MKRSTSDEKTPNNKLQQSAAAILVPESSLSLGAAAAAELVVRPRKGKWMDGVWVFNGGGVHPSGVFTTRDRAEARITRHELTGVLTKYPLDTGVYEWTVECGAFKPRRPDQSGPRFIGRFSSASLEHYHYEAGQDAEQSDSSGED